MYLYFKDVVFIEIRNLKYVYIYVMGLRRCVETSVKT